MIFTAVKIMLPYEILGQRVLWAASSWEPVFFDPLWSFKCQINSPMGRGPESPMARQGCGAVPRPQQACREGSEKHCWGFGGAGLQWGADRFIYAKLHDEFFFFFAWVPTTIEKWSRTPTM